LATPSNNNQSSSEQCDAIGDTFITIRRQTLSSMQQIIIFPDIRHSQNLNNFSLIYYLFLFENFCRLTEERRPTNKTVNSESRAADVVALVKSVRRRFTHSSGQ